MNRIHELGDQDYDAALPFLQERRMKRGWPTTRGVAELQENMVQMGLRFLNELIAANLWRVMGWVCEGSSHAVISSLREILRWRSTTWWNNT